MPMTSEWNELFRGKQKGKVINLKEPVDITEVTDSKVVEAPKKEEAKEEEVKEVKRTASRKKKEDKK